MSIEQRLDRIRSKPENVRIWYIVVFVTISMALVVLLWFFSLRVQMQAIVDDVRTTTTLPGRTSPSLRELRETFGDTQKAVRNAQDAAAQFGGVVDGTAEESVTPAATTPQQEAAPQQEVTIQ